MLKLPRFAQSLFAVPGRLKAAGEMLGRRRPTLAVVAEGSGVSDGGNAVVEPAASAAELRINTGQESAKRQRAVSFESATIFENTPLPAEAETPVADTKVPVPPPTAKRGLAESADQAVDRTHKQPVAADVPKPPTQSRQPASVRDASSDGDHEMLPAGAAYSKRLGRWKLPPLSLLTPYERKFTAAQESQLRAKAKILEQCLAEFRVDARVVEIDTGPVITMFELELSPGIKVSRIASLANDIARAMKAPAVRIVSPIPGKNTIGVEVPNIDKEIVRLRTLMMAGGDKVRDMAVPLLLGKDASGNALVLDLADMPHLLIAGTTGSGKSVAINAIIMSILMCRRPDAVKLVLIDPKMVELNHFKDIPHLMAPIITDALKAEQVLEWAVAKMEERYAILAEARVRNVKAYNRLGDEEILRRFQPTSDSERRQIPIHLPYIVIIIDELADLMMMSAKEVEHHLSRLAQKSRAVGIHIIVATQRPEARVVTGLIKSNLPCRCAFRVASRMDSRIVLDQNGAEVLMGEGDMLFIPPGAHKPVRAQGTYVEDKEMHGVLAYLDTQGRPDFHPELVRATRGSFSNTERDPLFDEAVKIILETGRGSVSLLQRRLMVGYSRAARLIDQMADAGVVGDYKGSQAREVVMTMSEWQTIRQQMVTEEAEEEQEAERVGMRASEARHDEAVDTDDVAVIEGEQEDDDSVASIQGGTSV